MNVDDEINALFAGLLEEFTSARNALAARLKKSGQRQEAERVKALAKPSITAWAANQLYWKHRSAFQDLIVTGERVLAAQADHFAGKNTDMREPLEARREALSRLTRLAAAMLSEAGHNPTPDKMRRLTATLEALSVQRTSAEADFFGRLADDIDAPGFEFFATMMPDRRPVTATTPTVPVEKTGDADVASRQEAAAAQTAFQNAERILSEVRAKAREVDTMLETAVADANEAEKRFEQANGRVRALTAEAQRASAAVNAAEHAVEQAASKLQSLHRSRRS